MLILKLKAPEATVNYDQVGLCCSTPVPFTPDKIKLQMPVEITGYVTKDKFFAFKLFSPDRGFSLSEQYTLLAQLGFNLVPTAPYPSVPGAVNALINEKGKYIKYNAYWWDMDKNEEYIVPDLVRIDDVSFRLDEERRLARVLHTVLGDIDIIDHRAPECYQTGCLIKLLNNKVEPYNTRPIETPIPVNCPVCNNPLTKYQLGPDLPLILKCKAPLCQKLVVTDEPSNEEEKEEEVTGEPSFPGQDSDTDTELQDNEGTVSDKTVEEDNNAEKNDNNPGSLTPEEEASNGEEAPKAEEGTIDQNQGAEGTTGTEDTASSGDTVTESAPAEDVAETETQEDSTDESAQAEPQAQSEEGPSVGTISQDPVVKFNVPKTTKKSANKITVIDTGCEYPVEWTDKVNFVKEAPADYIFVKTKRNVSKAIKTLSKDNNIPLITYTELEEKVNEQ